MFFPSKLLPAKDSAASQVAGASLLFAALCLATTVPAAGQDYYEFDSGNLIDIWPTTNWTCGLDLGDPVLEEQRCTISKPASSTGNPLPRYIFNGAVTFQIPASECAAGTEHCGYTYHLVQQNNGSPDLNDGPAGQFADTGGDEWVIFRCPEDDPVCAHPDLVMDHVRPANPGCSPNDDPSCIFFNWQLKSAVYEPNRGPNGKVTVFSKNAMRGGQINAGDPNGEPNEALIQQNHVVMNRHEDPTDYPIQLAQNGSANGWETVFFNRQDNRQCEDPSTPACGGPEHAYRLIDLALITDPIASRPGLVDDQGQDQSQTNGYIGYLSWVRDNDPAPGCNCCEVLPSNTSDRCDNDLDSGGTFVVIKSRVGTWFAVPGQPASTWPFVAWGEAVEFELPRQLTERRTFDIHAADLGNGTVRYEGWQIKAGQGNSNPCPLGIETAIYQANMQDYDQGDGRKPVYFTFDPVTGAASDLAVNLNEPSWDRDHIPSEYRAAFTWMGQRYDHQDPDTGHQRSYYLAGSRDSSICHLPNNNIVFTGKGVWWSRLLSDPSLAFVADHDAGFGDWSTVVNQPSTSNHLEIVGNGFPGKGAALALDVLDPATTPKATAYVQDDIGQGNSSAVQGSFYINPQDLDLPLGTSLRFMTLFEHFDNGAGAGLVFFLQRNGTSGDWFISVWHRNEVLAKWTATGKAFFALDGDPLFRENRIDFEWSNGDPGRLRLWRTRKIDDAPDYSGRLLMFDAPVPGQAGLLLNHVRLGLPNANSLKDGANGRLLLDELRIVGED